MTTIAPDELPNRAFQLAYFMHRERKAAVEIATRALNKLQLAATAQGKRLYYRLTGRADARKARSKVSMGEPHLLQRLVYVESEEYERKKEAAANNSPAQTGATPARQSDLVVYFIKHLVRITTRRNSFYVTLGLSRLLYNYTTPETMELYNLVIQDPDRVPDDYYYRSRKGLLLKELKERFGALVELAKGTRGEQRWRAGEDSLSHAALVRDCLVWFTPWSTPCLVPERFDPLSDTIDQLRFKGRHADEEHEVEVNRIHAALHPDCFARLVAANRLAAPEDRLELPHFFLANGADDVDPPSRTPPNISDDELATINDLLAQEAARRKSVSAGFLRVLVDGIQRAEINGEHSPLTQFTVDEQAEVIEVYGADQLGPLLLATHLLNFNGPDTQNLTIVTEGGQRIEFTVNLLRGESAETTGARLVVACKETAPARRALIAARRMWASIVPAPGFSGWWKPVSALAVLLLLVAGTFWVWTNRQKREELVGITPTPAPTVPVSSSPSPARQNDSEPQRQPESPSNPAPKNGNQAPAPVLAQREPGTSERNDDLVERTLITNSSVTGDDPGELATRGTWNRELMGKPLNEIHQVYLQGAAGNVLSEGLLNELRARFTNQPGLQLSGIDQADAALKITVQPAGQAGDSRVIAIVRVVNANGYIVWPASRNGSSWRYVGRPRYVAGRVIADLTRDIERARQR